MRVEEVVATADIPSAAKAVMRGSFTARLKPRPFKVPAFSTTPEATPLATALNNIKPLIFLGE
jgi:hypothetical protein